MNNKDKEIVSNINDFVKSNFEDLEGHYYSVIDKNCEGYKKAIDNQIYIEIDNQSYTDELIEVSFVTLTANFFECEILNLNSFLDSKCKIKKLRGGINLFQRNDFRVIDAYIISLNGYKILHLHAPETGSNTPCGSADLVRYVNNNPYINPSCIISFGICYGIDPKNQSLGDTIIAEKIYPCSIGLKINESDWFIKHDDYIIDLRLSQSTLYHEIDNIIKGIKDTVPNLPFKRAIMGNMLTGEAVVSNQKYKIKAVEKSYGCKIIGGEMEGYGLAKECIYYSDIPCLIIKAICDWGALKNIDEHLDSDILSKVKKDCKGKIQAYTAYCAYTVLRKLIFEKIFDKSNVYEYIREYIFETYMNDGFVRKNILKRNLKNNCFVNSSFKTKQIKECDIDKIIDASINLLVCRKILREISEEGIDGYSFE